VTTVQSVHVDAPVDEVFEFVKNPLNWPDIEPLFHLEDVTRTPDGLGTTYRWKTRIAGLPIRGTGKFTEFVPNRRISDRTTPSVGGTWTYLFEPQGSGTKVTVQHEPAWYLRIPVVGGAIDSFLFGHSRVLTRLKLRLEA
jgi:hypothetical protein